MDEAADAAPWLRLAVDRFGADGLALILARCSEMIVVVDHVGSITFANPACEVLLGYESTDLVGLPGFDFVHREDRPVADRTMAALLAGSLTEGPVRLRMGGAEASWRHTEVVALNCLDKPSVAGIVLNMKDVTDRELAVAAMRESDRRFRELADGVPDVIFRCVPRPVPRFQYASRALESLTGYTPEELYAAPDVLLRVLDPKVIERLMAMEADAALQAPVEFPLRHRDGSEVWVQLRLTLHRDDEGEIVLVDGIIRDLTQRRREEVALRHLALHDQLTGLPNRAHFYERLQATLTADGETRAAVLFLDLDTFKQVNDRHGHAVGDQLLRVLAERLTAAVGPDDVVARLGGDEFLLLCADVTRDDELASMCERIRDAVRRPIVVGADELRIDVSVGSVRVSPGADIDSLVHLADQAMYRDKNAKAQRGR